MEPLYARQVLHRPPSQFALFEAAAGIGVILAGLAISRVRGRLADDGRPTGRRPLAGRRIGRGPVYRDDGGAGGLRRRVHLGRGRGAVQRVVVTTLQRLTPAHVHGRVMGLSATLQSWVGTIGLPLGGVTLAGLGIRPGALALAAVAAASGALALTMARPEC